MISVLGNITDQHIFDEPFAHIRHEKALDPDVYDSLAAAFPDVSHWREIQSKNNVSGNFSGLLAARAGIVPTVWNDFLSYHLSVDFYDEVLRHLGNHIRTVHPDLEERLGKRLEDLTVAPRHSGVAADVMLDCQFSINTAVRYRSRVRGVHVDNPNKLYNAIL